MRSFDRRFPMRYRILAALVTAACVMVARGAGARGRAPRGHVQPRAWPRSATVRDEANEADAGADAPRSSRRTKRSSGKHPASGYCDNALWQAANLAALAYERFGKEAGSQDRGPSVRPADEGVPQQQARRAGAPRRFSSCIRTRHHGPPLRRPAPVARGRAAAGIDAGQGHRRRCKADRCAAASPRS